MITRMIVLPDIHAPDHDPVCLKSALEFTKDYKPHYLVQLGDLCDFNSLSRHDVIKESDLHSFHKEVSSANEVLDQIEAVLPKTTKKVITEGNHDHRPESFVLNRWTKQAAGILGTSRIGTYVDLFHLRERKNWQWFPEGQCFKFGKALFTHGWYYNQYHAAKTVKMWFKSIFYGHTHQKQEHTIVGMDRLPVSGYSCGTLSLLDLPYMKGKPTNWTQMILAIDFYDNGLFTSHPLTMIRGKFVYGSKLYGSKVK